MWRLTREDSERGVVAPLTALLMVALLGMTAFSVDVAMMYSEHSQLQNGADSSALAVAQACANDSSSAECTAPDDLAKTMGNGNTLDNATNIQNLVVDTSAGTVDVTTQSRDTDGNNHFSLTFARALGIDTADIGASARASWGPPGAGPTLPWTFSWCVFEQALSEEQLEDLIATGDFTGDPSLTDVLIRYDTKAPTTTCNGPTGHVVPGGFGWLDQDDSGTCTADVSVDDASAGSDPGNNFPASCKAKLDALKTGPTLIPIFQETNGESGNNAEYTIYGFAAFQATGWRFGGQPELNWNSTTAPACTGDCRGIKGHFVRFLSFEEGLTGTGPNLGGTTARLIG
ncbi:Tad domain-containing protein [Arthrobacter sp. R1-13]